MITTSTWAKPGCQLVAVRSTRTASTQCVPQTCWHPFLSAHIAWNSDPDSLPRRQAACRPVGSICKGKWKQIVLECHLCSAYSVGYEEFKRRTSTFAAAAYDKGSGGNSDSETSRRRHVTGCFLRRGGSSIGGQPNLRFRAGERARSLQCSVAVAGVLSKGCRPGRKHLPAVSLKTP